MMKASVHPFESGSDLQPAGRIDELVLRRLKTLGIQPARPCSDEVFVRRVHLDAIGTIPTSAEARAFLADKGPGKRAALIDRLLQRPEFADYWAMKWSDILRVKSEFPINLWPLAAENYHRWIRTCLAENWPYDRFARAMLSASGSNFRAPETNFYRAVPGKEPETLARMAALTFMGVRTDKWPEPKRKAMGAFFSQVGYKATREWKEEVVFNDLAKAAGRPVTATLPDGKSVRLPEGGDPRVAFCDWLIKGQNPWFAPSVANRIWTWLMGRGIVHEPDDFRPDNPPRNPELLAHLAQSLVTGGWDLKKLIRQILNSSTYQLSSIPQTSQKSAADEFAFYRLRQLEAEVLIDAIDQITGTTEAYSSMTPEPFTFIPEERRSITLADVSITSSFLEMFGRPARDSGLASERINSPTAAQRLHLLNSSHIQRKIERGPKLVALLKSAKTQPELVDELTLAILSRFPTADERTIALEYIRGAGSPQVGAIDLAWAALNSSEFLYRH